VEETEYGGASYSVPSPRITRVIRSRRASNRRDANRRDANTVLGTKETDGSTTVRHILNMMEKSG